MRNPSGLTPFKTRLASDTITMVIGCGALSSSLLLTDGDEKGGAIPLPFCGHCIRQFAVRQDRQQTASLRRRKKRDKPSYRGISSCCIFLNAS
jgi:hypothetical protein